MRFKRQTAVDVRYMIKRDLPEVLAIERSSFATGWVKEDFLACMRQRNFFDMVAETDLGSVAGFMVYEREKTTLHLVNFAVAPRYRRRGVGAAMLERLKGKTVEQHRRRTVTLEVMETNVAAQCFFRSQGFRAVRILRDHYLNSDEDAYEMTWDAQAAVTAYGGRLAAYW
jgi:ribosomal-protein-alanine N-acetyltransferase